MNRRRQLISIIILGSFILSACGPSKDEQAATVTQMAADIFSTETAQVPTITPTFTPSPTATVTLTPTTTNTPTVTPFPTYEPWIIFWDDFSNPNRGWEHFKNENGLNDYANGGYRIFINSAYSFFWDTVRISQENDVIIDVDTQKVAGPDYAEYGVICRWVSINNYYKFSISGDGHYDIWKVYKGEGSTLSGKIWAVDNQVIHTGNSANHVRVTCYKEDLRLEVNGAVLMDVHDADITSGEVGLYADVGADPGIDILFDNFVVYRP